jgi:hypothetical protein
MAIKKLIAKIVRLADQRGLTVRTDYSGRFMFGQKCVGIVGEPGECAALATLVKKKTGFLYRFDSMGMHDQIYYFPEIDTTNLD